MWDLNSFEALSGDWRDSIDTGGIYFDGKGYSTFVWKQSQAEYYRLAAIFYHDKEFKDCREREIWGLHAEGFSVREIAKKINLTPRQVFYSIQIAGKRFGLIKNDK